MNIMINYSASSCKPVFGGGVSGLSASTSELAYSSPAALAELKTEEGHSADIVRTYISRDICPHNVRTISFFGFQLWYRVSKNYCLIDSSPLKR